MNIYDNSPAKSLPQTAAFNMILNHFKQPRENNKLPKCLIVGYDGARADALSQCAEGESGILELKKDGGKVYRMHTGGPFRKRQDTSTATGWTTLLTGTWARGPGGHGVVSNRVMKEIEPKLIFTKVMEQNADVDKISFIVSWGGHFTDDSASYRRDIAYHAEKNLNADWLTFDSDEKVFAATKSELLAENGAGMVMCILEHCDHTGHGHGYGNQSPEYVEGFRTSDRNAFELIQAVKSRPGYANEDWLIIISSDHGGKGKGHGGQSAECRRVFLAANKNLGF